MCRFIAYMGKPLILYEVLFTPDNSLIKQSTHAREAKEPLNGDGFGLGWYELDIDPEPGLFRSIQPAWNDLNLQYLSKKLRSNCFFAHVRAAGKGRVSQDNCHPFHYKELLFMHNGSINEFHKIKRPLRQKLSDETYNWVQGQTDSEHLFALFLERFKQQNAKFDMFDIPKLIAETIIEINELKEHHNADSNTVINAVLTNGKSMFAIRYSADSSIPPPSLYYNIGSQFTCINNAMHIMPPKPDINEIVMIVSEPLTPFKEEWLPIPINHMLLVCDDLSISLKTIF